MRVYLDYAATSPLRKEVLEKMLPYLTKTFGNPDSLHSFGREAALAVTAARDKIAEVLGVEPSEVYFTSGGSEAVNWAVQKLGEGGALVSSIEHASALSAMKLRKGSRLCPVGTDGIVRPETVSDSLQEGAGLVCVMAVNNETGCVQPVEEIAAISKERGALFFSDCVQAAFTQDLKAICAKADAAALSGHKLGAPKGIGALIVKKGARISPLIAGGEQERGLRGGTLNVAGIVGFAEALFLAQRDRLANAAHTGSMRNRFEEILIASLGERVRRDGQNRAPNISHLTFEGIGDAFLDLLDLKGVAASGGAACSAHAALPSHVLVAMGRTEEEAKRGIRFSFGPGTTEKEVDFAAKTVLSCLKG